MPVTCTTAGTGYTSADATWLVTGAGTNNGPGADLAAGVLTPDTGPGWTINQLIGHKIQLGGAGPWYVIASNTATTATLTSPPADGIYSWVLGGVPLDGDGLSVEAAHTATVDQDLSGWTTGFNGITIKGAASGNPGQLVFWDYPSIVAKINLKAGTNIVGTNLAVFGRLLMAGGTWAAPTDLVASRTHNIVFLGATAGYVDLTYLDAKAKCATPTNLWVTPYGYCLPVTWQGSPTNTITLPTNYELIAQTAITFVGATIPGGLTAGTTYHVVNIVGQTFQVAATVNGVAITLGGSGSAVLATGQSRVTVVAATNVFTLTDDAGNAGSALTLMAAVAVGTALVNTTPIRFYTTGTLPAPLTSYELYYVRDYSAGTFKVALTSGGAAVDITDTGTGTIRAFIGVPITHGAGAGDELPIFENVTGAGNETWAAGAQVVLANEGPQAYDQQRLTITALTARTIELSADCDSLQFPGARIFLATRNVALRSNSTGATAPIVNAGVGATLQCEIRNVAGSGTTFYGYGVSGGTSHTNSGVFSGNSSGVYIGTSHTNSGVFSGNSAGIYYGTSHTNSGVFSGCTRGIDGGTSHTNSGVFSGNSSGVFSGTSHTNSGVFSGNTNGINLGSCSLLGATMRGNTQDLNGVDVAVGFSSALESPIQFTGYKKSVAAPNWRTICMYDPVLAGVPQIGQVKAWGPYGTIITEAAPATPPVALAYAYKMIPEASVPATPQHPTFLDFVLLAKKDVQLSVNCYVKQNAAGMTVRPTFQLLDPAVDFNVSNPASTLATATAANDTNWQTINLTYTSTVADRMVTLRCFGTPSAALEFWHWMFVVSGGGVFIIED